MLLLFAGTQALAQPPAVGAKMDDVKGMDCTVVKVGPKPFRHAIRPNVQAFLNHAEQRWVAVAMLSPAEARLELDPAVPSAKWTPKGQPARELLTKDHPKGGHYFLRECTKK